MYKRIITHADFDGVVSAALCSFALKVNYFVFTQPRLIMESRVSTTTDDVVCDLPYPLECGLWFDHHEGNIEDLSYRGVDMASLKGRFEAKESCARVVYDYFQARGTTYPDFMANTVEEADVIDSFSYKDIEDWRRETPGKIIDSTIRLKEDSAEQKWEYLRNLVRQLKDRSIDQVADMPSVKKRYKQYLDKEERMIAQIKQDIFFLPEDKDHKVIIVDVTHHNRRPQILKQLAYLVHPESEAVLQIGNIFEDQTKTNNLTVSMSLSLNMNTVKDRSKDVGEIMRTLNLGNGHPGAAAGIYNCQTKEEMLKVKPKLIGEIYKQFISQ